jgi:hypothetical protein
MEDAAGRPIVDAWNDARDRRQPLAVNCQLRQSGQ